MMMMRSLVLSLFASIGYNHAMYAQVQNNTPPAATVKMHIRQQETYQNTLLRGRSKSNSNKMLTVFENIMYHPPGQIMTDGVNVYNIYYGDFSSPASRVTISLLDYFVSNIGSTSWYQIVSRYYDNNYVTNNDKIYNAYNTEYASSYISLKMSSNVAQSATGEIKERDIFDSIKLFLQTNNLQPDENAIYAVMFNGGLHFTAPDQSTWLGDWCGYHGYFIYGGIKLKFMVLGDPSTAKTPNNGCSFSGSSPPNSSPGADAMVNMYGHELVETVTDPYLNAWYFSNGDENMDRCAWIYDPYLPGMENNANIQVGNRYFLLQQTFVPNQGCMMPPATSSLTLTSKPSTSSSMRPSPSPTITPSFRSPTKYPSKPPKKSPFKTPSMNPTFSPTAFPSQLPSRIPKVSSTRAPTYFPRALPSQSPSKFRSPSKSPSNSPSASSTWYPSTALPSSSPSKSPSSPPTYPSSLSPSYFSTSLRSPSKGPSSKKPTKKPVLKPTRRPSHTPSQVQ